MNKQCRRFVNYPRFSFDTQEEEEEEIELV